MNFVSLFLGIAVLLIEPLPTLVWIDTLAYDEHAQ